MLLPHIRTHCITMTDPTYHPIVFREERTLGGIINATVRIVRDHVAEILSSILPIVAGPLVLSLLVSLFTGQLKAAFSLDTFNTDPASMEQALGFLDQPGLYLLGMLMSMLTSWLTLSSAYGYILLYREGMSGSVDARLLWKSTKPLLGPIGILVLVVTAAYVVLTLMNLIPCLGALAYLVLTIWGFPVLLMLPAARVFDTHGAGEAFERVRSLIKGHWGRSFGVALVLFIVLFVLAVAVWAPLFLVGASLSSMGGVLGSAVLVVLWAVSAVVGLLFYIMPALTGTLMYFSLLAEVEGPELDDRIEEIGMDDEQPLF